MPRPRSTLATALGPTRSLWLPVGALCLACGNGGQTGDEHDGAVVELRGTAQRLGASGPLPNSASADNWSFGWRLYGEDADVTKNTFLSPYSVSLAASMLYAGAAGQTLAEMQSALSFSSDGEVFHQARNSVALALEARNRPASEERNAQTLRVANDLWLDPEFRPNAPFLDTLSAYYGAGVFLAPFATEPEAARLAINDKVADDTEGLIEELLPERSVDDAAFVLTNALYFKARWATEFSADATAPQPFEAQSGASVEVPMMRVELMTPHMRTDAYEAVALAYDQNELELVAIMPASGGFESFVGELNAAAVERITSELEPLNIDLRFPKLSIDASVPLEERLRALGMVRAFEPGDADFSALSDTPVFISDAFHQATIEIDEQGTIAAAATAFVGRPTSAPPPPVPVVFDRPFVFFIRDVETNALLFVGHYANP